MANEQPGTVVVERGGNGMTFVIGLALVVLLAIGAWFLMNQTRNDNIRTDAVAGAAKDVGDTARKVGDAVDPDK